jgi:hypothetical protein
LKTTPIAFFDEEKRLVVYAPNQPLRKINPWLFKNSLLYRFTLGTRKNITKQEITKEIQDKLIELKEILQKDGIAFSVVILPLFIPYENWTQSEKTARDKIIRIFQIQHIRCFDLLNPLREAISQGMDVQEIPGESWHPNEKISQVFALYLFKHKLF